MNFEEINFEDFEDVDFESEYNDDFEFTDIVIFDSSLSMFFYSRSWAS